MRSPLGLSTFVASLVALAAARNLNLENRHKPMFAKRHAHHGVVHEPDRRSENEVAILGARDLEKRYDGARFTFYDAGLGACGQSNSNSDFIVALNAIQFDSAKHCFETITITVGSKTASAVIADRCEGCPYGGLDFSRGLFKYFADESAGVLTGSWSFGGGTPQTTYPTTTPTTTINYIQTTPTTTYIQPLPSTTSTPIVYTPAPSSSSVRSSLSFSSSTPSFTSSALNALWSSSSNATNSSTVEGVLEQLNLVLVNLGAMVVVGRS